MIKEINKAMRQEMEVVLNAASIWHIDAIGWLNADDMDPEFIGHAMWQTDRPLDDDWSTFNARRPTKEQAPSIQPPEEWTKVIAVSGVDFEGLMKAARMSIGLFLIQTKIGD